MRVLFFLFSLVIPIQLFAQVSAPSSQADMAKKTYSDIEKNLGIVPTFMKNFPEAGITGAWEDMKGLQLNPETAIPGKFKELIGLAVASQIPCRYCVYFHTQAAILNGASQKEIKEAIAVSGVTRRWSSIFNGMQLDLNEFKNDVNKIQASFDQKKGKQAMEIRQAELKTPDEVYQDIQSTFGFVPNFIRNYPKTNIVGAWKEVKNLVMSPATSIPVKYKYLMGLAVSSQIPCSYLTYLNTQFSLQQGASKDELNEAVAMAGITREWSTVLNGQYTDEKKFKDETDKIMKYVKSKMPKEVTQAD